MRKLKAVYIRPREEPKVVTIDDSLEYIEMLVEGGFDTTFPWGPGVVLVCNDMGMLNGMEPNRIVNGWPIYGPFFICGLYGPDMVSLKEADEKKYLSLFAKPEHFLLLEELDDGTKVVLWTKKGSISGEVIRLPNPRWTVINLE